MTDVAAIVLAGGMSRRMGARNKLLLPMAGEPILCRVVRACAAVSDHPVTVVTGDQSTEIASALQLENVTLVHNSRYASGQMTSVEAGLRAAPEAALTLLALGDQPFLSAEALGHLITAHVAHAGDRITVPHVEGIRGNPIVFPLHMRRSMIADPINLGCRKLTRQRPDLVWRFNTAHKGFVLDIDTPEDFANLSRQIKKESVACTG